MNKPVPEHGSSLRPATEIIIVPDSINIEEVGACRDHEPFNADAVYCAMLLTAKFVVSVAQIELALENANPNGFIGVATSKVPTGLTAVGNPVNLLIPAPVFPELVPSVQYNAEDVATIDPTQD